MTGRHAGPDSLNALSLAFFSRVDALGRLGRLDGLADLLGRVLLALVDALALDLREGLGGLLGRVLLPLVDALGYDLGRRCPEAFGRLLLELRRRRLVEDVL